MNFAAGGTNHRKLYSRERLEVDLVRIKSGRHGSAEFSATDQNTWHLISVMSQELSHWITC